MRTILRTLGLLAPLVIVVAIARAVVLAVFYATAAWPALALATGLLCLVAVVAALFARRRPPPGDGPDAAAVRQAVDGLVRSPGDGIGRQVLMRHMVSFDEIRVACERLAPHHEETLRRVLRELNAARRLQEIADTGARRERVMAARNLAWLQPAYVVERLERLALDPDPEVALAGARGLAATPKEAAYRALVRLIDAGPLPPSRTAAALENAVYPDLLAAIAPRACARSVRKIVV